MIAMFKFIYLAAFITWSSQRKNSILFDMEAIT
jgi:hypothetical protein